MDYMGKYLQWSTDPFFDEETRNELQSIRENSAEILDRFNNDLSFGTGGLRGIIGAGTNRMNKYTVGKATQGLANYILKMGGADKGVAIAFDSRHMSPEFSEQAALCLNANGIKTFRFESLRPTPELSFALRELGCMAGIVVTASHNPPEYNGYKVYWEDGAQITSPRDCEIIAEVNAVQDFSSVKMIDRFDAERRGLFNVIGAEIDDRYIEELKKLVLSPEAIAKCGEKLSIVYTPLHGTGNMPVKRILDELGFEKVFVVPEQ
ncbi:MAG: phospho-sugar mutase, partial [Candidatus Paracaedibacteraceae bacterium]|nr:phospho-sugar mutase [Candidatus Paracaedibacteraceae bacterium]